MPVTHSSAKNANEWGTRLRLNNIDLMMNTAYEYHMRPPAADPAARRPTATYCSPDLPMWMPASAHLHAEGIDVKPPAIAPYGMKQLFFHDPDGSCVSSGRRTVCCKWAWVLKKALSRNSQKLHRVRMLYQRLSLFG